MSFWWTGVRRFESVYDKWGWTTMASQLLSGHEARPAGLDDLDFAAELGDGVRLQLLYCGFSYLRARRYPGVVIGDGWVFCPHTNPCPSIGGEEFCIALLHSMRTITPVGSMFVLDGGRELRWVLRYKEVPAPFLDPSLKIEWWNTRLNDLPLNIDAWTPWW